MADETDTPANDTGAPVPRRRAPRKSASKAEAAKPPAAKRASRPAAAPAKKPAAKSAPKPAPTPPSASKPQTRTDRARDTLGKAADAAGGKRGLIAGGLIAAAAGAAAAALLSLRGSTARNKGVPANDPGSKAHQPDGTDSSGQMEAMIADESMIPETKPV
jgi:hypothetical protein